jgi:putative radical SAM enzyme (TIGR03279 family)
MRLLIYCFLRVKILNVHKKSPAARIGLMPGDDLLAISGHKIHDELDFRFWLDVDRLRLRLKRQGDIFELEIEGGLTNKPLGVDFEPMQYRCCGNNCIFCFVDQNPAGLRRSLYFKDEDYRLSFLFGNYVTLTNVSQKALERIVEQRLSPIYISVHVIDPARRQQMLGLRKDDRLLHKIDFLAAHKIEMHAQVVLCPGWNDGYYLDETVDALSRYFPYVKTVAVVPVGLTKHRDNLPQLKPVTRQVARKILEWEKKKSKYFLSAFRAFFVYLADEFYILTDKPIPPAERYDAFDQLENGVGMARNFLDRFHRERKRFPRKMNDKKLTVITGTMAYSLLNKDILPHLKRIPGLDVRIIPVENSFYGSMVGVSGLLTGRDIATTLKECKPGELVALPPNCTNYDHKFLDDYTIPQLEAEIGTACYQSSDNFLEILKALEKENSG